MLCTRNEHSAVGQFYFKRNNEPNKLTHRKSSQIYGYQRQGLGAQGTEKVFKRYKLPYYEINKYWDVMYNRITRINTARCYT